jgi:predicted transcriptional regulator
MSWLTMERITIRLSDDLSAELSRQAAETGVSRARWVRETIIAELTRRGTASQLLEFDARLRRVEAHLGAKDRLIEFASMP